MTLTYCYFAEEAALTWTPKPMKELYDTISKSNATSLMKKYLTPEVYEKYKDKKTSLGGTLAHCINSGIVCCKKSPIYLMTKWSARLA